MADPKPAGDSRVRPKVSIIIPVYNDEANVRRAIDSALSQTLSEVEVVVVDDGSTDGTPDVLSEYEGRIRAFRQDNRGAAAARNVGISESRGRYVCFLDSDDEFTPQKAQLQSDFLDGNPGTGLCYGGWQDLDMETGAVLRDFTMPRPEGNQLRDPFPPGFPIFAPLVRREWLERVGGFDEELWTVEDSALWWRLWSEGCRFRRVRGVVALRRARGGSLSKDIPLNSQYTVVALEKHFKRLGTPPGDAVRIRRLAGVWMKEAGHHLGTERQDLAQQAVSKALEYDPHLLRSPLNWWPLLTQLGLGYPLGHGPGIRDYRETWLSLLSLLRASLADEEGGDTDTDLRRELSALAFALSGRAFISGKWLETFRWFFKALSVGRGRLPEGFDVSFARWVLRSAWYRARSLAARLLRKFARSEHSTRDPS